MLEIYYKDPHTIQRLLSGITGPYLNGFAGILENRGYSRLSGRLHLRSAFHLGFWSERNNYGVHDFCKEFISKFSEHLPSCTYAVPKISRYMDIVVSARHFLDYLQKTGIVEVDICSQPENPPLFDGFHQWMKMHRGVTDRTLEIYKPMILDVIKALGDNPTRYRVQDIRGFIEDRMKDTGSAKAISKPLRMFLRYLVAEGFCSHYLVDAVPRISRWRLSTMPRYLPESEVKRIIDACPSDTPMGCRDRAIILLLARLGLRGDDIAKMRLGDINWTEGSILLSGKSRREVLLPLSQEIGDAILVYLQYGRPKVQNDHVFITSIAPIQPFKSGSTVSQIVKRAIRRAGVIAPSNGAHVLRHSAATAMLNQGVSLKEIADILRHRSIDTTVQYAKVHHSLLQEVVQSWPEVQSC